MDGQDVFLRLLLEHESELRAFIGSLIRDRDARQDVFQETALALWREFGRYDPARSFGAWARGVAAKKVLERWARLGRSPVIFSAEAVAAVEATYEHTETDAPPASEALRHCIDRLPEKSRRLLVLRYERSMSFERIAGEVRASVDAVCQTLSRLRSRLYECVQDWLAARGGA